MPQPTVTQVHIDRLLTNAAIRYAQKAENFVAGQVFPLLPVVHQSDYVTVFPKGYFMRDDMAPRPLGGRPNRTGFEIEKVLYACEEEALEYPLDDRISANADQPIDPELRAAELLAEKALIHRDRVFGADFFSASVWSTEYSGVASGSEVEAEKKFLKFSQSGSIPVKEILNWRTAMRRKTGQVPNVIVLGALVFNELINHPEVLERIKYTSAAPAIVTEQILAQLFRVDKVVVAESVQNSAPEGKADEIGFILNEKDILLAHAAPAPSLQTPSAGYTIAWTGLLPGVNNAFGGVIERGREELAHSDIFQVRTAFTMKATAADLGAFAKECV